MPRIWTSPYLLLTLTCLFWAGNSVLGRALRDDVPPIALSFWRWCTAFAILLPWVARPLARQWRTILAHWKVMVFLAILGIATYNTINYVALHTTTVTNSALINGACTLMIIAVNRLMFGVRAGWRQWIGLWVSICGVVVIVARGDLQVLLGLELVRGDVLLLIAAVAWAVYTACLRWRPRELDQLTFAGATIAIGALALAPLYLWEAASAAPVKFSAGVIAAIAYVAVFPSVLAMLFWNKAVADVGANRAAQFLNLVPVFGIALAIVFLDETLERFHLVGAGVIFAGIALATAGMREKGSPTARG